MNDTMALIAAEGINRRIAELERELAAERELRLRAEMEAEVIRSAIVRHQESTGIGAIIADGDDEDRDLYAPEVDLYAALAAPPPSLEPLHELLRAVDEWEERLTMDQDSRGNAEMRLMEKRDAALALYPFLREAEGD